MSDREELNALLRETTRIHEEFAAKSQRWQSIIATPVPQIIGAVREVLKLAELAPTVCAANQAEYWQHLVANPDASTDHQLIRLKEASHAAYSIISSCDKEFHDLDTTVSHASADIQDIIGRAESLEERANVLEKGAITSKNDAQKALNEQKEKLDTAQKQYETRYKEIEDLKEKNRRKYEVNQNVFTGLGDWLSRKDDQFNLGIALGITESDERNADAEKLKSLLTTLQSERDTYESIAHGYQKWATMLADAESAISGLSATGQKTQEYKNRTLARREELVARKNLMFTIDEELTDVENTMERFEHESSLPTVGEFYCKILGVLRAVIHYHRYESGLEPISRELLNVLQTNTDWGTLTEEDDDVRKLYEEVVGQLA